MPTVKITPAEKSAINAILDRVAGIEQILPRCTSDYWKAEAASIHESMKNDPAEDAFELWQKAEEMHKACENRRSAKQGAFQDAKALLKRKVLQIKGELVPIIVGAAERHVQPILDEAKAAQAAQDNDHRERKIDLAPCPASTALVKQADAILSSAKGGSLALVGME